MPLHLMWQKVKNFRECWRCRHGLGFNPPSYHEIKTKYLKQKMEETTKDIEEHILIWKKIGCTIMSDGWTDKRRRKILKFLVNNNKVTVFF